MVHHFLTFENAVEMTNQLIEALNSGELDFELDQLGKKFNIKFNPGSNYHVDQINRNCPECSGCHAGGCILGCFKHSKSSSVLCYWDQALEEIIGSKLVVHEIFHLMFEQGFTSNLSEDEQFELSEKFAQYGEKNFTPKLVFLGDTVVIEGLTINEIGGSISSGFFLAIGFSAFIILLFLIFGKTPYSIGKKSR